MRPSIGAVILLLAATLMLWACETTPSAPDTRPLVVRAYLYAGQPVTDVEIRDALPLGAADTALPPINDATVSLTKAGRRYQLTPAGGDSGYYAYAGTDLTVAPNDTFELEITHGARRATATTVVPSPPRSVVASDTLLAVSAPSGGGIIADPREGVTLRWTTDVSADTTARLFYVVTQSVDTDAPPLRAGGPPAARRIVNAPTPADSFRVIAARLTYYGRHVARVYHVNREYAYLYDTRQQNTRDLNEPRTNVRGGLGIFSAFSADSASFVVVDR